MTIHADVTIESPDSFYLRTILNATWAQSAASPADLSIASGLPGSQSVHEEPNGINITMEQAAFSFDTSNLQTTYGAAMEITSAKFKFEIITVSFAGSWGLTGYYNNFNPLQLSDWVNPPPTETTAFSNVLISAATGIQEGILSNPDINIQTTGITGMIVVPAGVANNVAPASSKTLEIAIQSHATAFAPSLIMTIDDHKPPGNAAPLVWQAF